MSETLLQVENMSVAFATDEGTFNAVENVSFDVHPGKVVGLVGESGCGKSVTALSILRLVPSPPGKVAGGRVLFKGRDLLKLDSRAMRAVRGSDISMIFQEPQSALSPLKHIGSQMVEAVRLHRPLRRARAWELSAEWMTKVGISDVAEKRFAYPYQLSGGMQQRVMIAMALMLQPDLVIADEPTTALDVTIQAQIFQILRRMKADRTAILLITHDMGVIWEMCDLVLVMYAARIVEAADVKTLFNHPGHPYTRGLLQSIPRLAAVRRGSLASIPGSVPSPLDYPAGCRFQSRCPHVFDRCRTAQPPLSEIGNGHRAACFAAADLMKAPPPADMAGNAPYRG